MPAGLAYEAQWSEGRKIPSESQSCDFTTSRLGGDTRKLSLNNGGVKVVISPRLVISPRASLTDGESQAKCHLQQFHIMHTRKSPNADMLHDEHCAGQGHTGNRVLLRGEYRGGGRR